MDDRTCTILVVFWTIGPVVYRCSCGQSDQYYIGGIFDDRTSIIPVVFWMIGPVVYWCSQIYGSNTGNLKSKATGIKP